MWEWLFDRQPGISVYEQVLGLKRTLRFAPDRGGVLDYPPVGLSKRTGRELVLCIRCRLHRLRDKVR
jgi:hypothetical protein